MPATQTADRTALDTLLASADAALRERNAIESCCRPEWRAAHFKASGLYRAASEERARLFKNDRWGKWMTRHDRTLATITGDLTVTPCRDPGRAAA